MSRLRERTTATLLIAIFMISIFAVAIPVSAVQDRLVPSQYSTIQAAIHGANPGDIIIVAAGTYLENIIIYKSLTLIGAGASTTTINGGGSGIVVIIAADDVRVSGFTITGSGSTPTVDGGVALVDVTGCTIEDNIISNNDGIGIGLQGGSSNTIRNNLLDANHITGIGLLGSSDNTIVSNTVTGTIEGLTTSVNHAGYGLWLEYWSSDNLIEGNTFSGNEVDGVYFGQGSDGNELTDNIISNNGVEDGADSHGVYFWMSGGNTVTGNTITGNLASGIHLYDSKDNEIHYNNIYGNHDYGIYTSYSTDPITVDATFNYWGSPRGPSRAMGKANGHEDVKGDRVSSNVRFAPWSKDEFQ